MLANPLRAITLALTLLVATSAAGAQVRFTTSFDTALEQARERSCLVLVALHAKGTRGTQAITDEGHYRDKRIAELAEQTVNLRVEMMPGAPRGDELTVREKLLLLEDPEALAPLPCHLFVAPDEEPRVVSGATGYLTIGQLEWLWADALKRHDESFEWQATDRTRAPLTFQVDAVGGEGTAFPPTKDQLEAALDALDDGWGAGGGWEATLNNYRTVLSSDDRKAMKFAESSLRSLPRTLSRNAMRMVAENSPRPWHKFAEGMLTESRDSTREGAARALEALREPKSSRVLLRYLPKEEEIKPQARMLRALAACDPGNRKTLQMIERYFGKSRDPYMIAQAVGAAGELEDLEALTKLLKKAVTHRETQVRLAAVAVIAARRDPRLTPILDELHDAQETVSEAAETARSVLETPNPAELQKLLSEGLDDQGSLRSDWEAMRARMRGRRGGDDGEQDEDEDQDEDGTGKDDEEDEETPRGRGRGRRGGGGR